MHSVAERLEALKQAGLRRHLMVPDGIDLSSNDVLGLSRDPAIAEAVCRALEKGLPTGSTGSRLLSGHDDHWTALEQRFADWQKRQASLFFSSGYAANIGLLSGLIEPGDTVLSDAMNHASIIDALRLSKGRVEIVPHNDLEAYQRALEASSAGAWVAVESVFSMDGDCAPLEALAKLAKRHHARLIVDEAHSTGLYGELGAGRCSQLPPGLEPFASLHPCGKALGLSGAFICADSETIDLLINKARSFIYSTAPTPMLAPALAASIDRIQSLGTRRSRPLDLAQRLRDRLSGRLDVGRSQSQIVPIILGSVERTQEVSTKLAAKGWSLRALRPPTVPPGTSRLRIVLRSDLSDDQVDQLAEDLLDVA